MQASINVFRAGTRRVQGSSDRILQRCRRMELHRQSGGKRLIGFSTSGDVRLIDSRGRCSRPSSVRVPARCAASSDDLERCALSGSMHQLAKELSAVRATSNRRGVTADYAQPDGQVTRALLVALITSGKLTVIGDAAVSGREPSDAAAFREHKDSRYARNYRCRIGESIWSRERVAPTYCRSRSRGSPSRGAAATSRLTSASLLKAARHIYRASALSECSRFDAI